MDSNVSPNCNSNSSRKLKRKASDQLCNKASLRVTKRELIRSQQDGDQLIKAEIPTSEPRAELLPPRYPGKGVNQASNNAIPLHIQDEFINLVKTQGLERIATEVGLLKNGEFRDLKQKWDTPTGRASSSSTPTSAQSKKRRIYRGAASGEKISKGLRHFSMKVCQKVEEKNITTYNEVADELVQEFVHRPASDSSGSNGYDEKNIRRRVYDALNVLMAMNIISKEKKEIRWKGLPSNAKQDFELLSKELDQRKENIEEKKLHLQELLLQIGLRKFSIFLQQIALKNLINRNSNRPTTLMEDEGRIALPFILVSTQKDTIIQCEMSEDRQDIFFNFSSPFEISDDSEVLREMKMHELPSANESCMNDELKKYIPEKLIPFVHFSSHRCVENQQHI